MKFLGMGVPELLIILVVILLIFGPKEICKNSEGAPWARPVKNLQEGMGDSKRRPRKRLTKSRVEED